MIFLLRGAVLLALLSIVSAQQPEPKHETIVVTGVYDYIEIWNAERFREVEGAGAAAMSSGEVDDFGL